MRAYLLISMLVLSTFACSTVAQEKRLSIFSSARLNFVAAGPAQITYQILCRGNTGGVYFKNIDSRTLTTGEKIVTYELVFAPSRQAAGPNGRGLEPGQCSWIDRPVNEKEPYAIRFDLPFDAQLKQKLNGTPVDSSPTAAERFPDAFTVPEYMKDKNHYYSFYAYNTRQSYLLATSGKYFKPPTNIGDVLRGPGDSASNRNESPYVLVRPADLNALAAKGEALATQTPLALELRNQMPEGPARRGFDIGLAAAEGQTSPGPGKQKIHDVLSPPEQRGFDSAVSFSLERNRNAELAARGAAIAETDPVVAEARNVETDVFYRLGFDIATGIFGDPALGALGNTATGPGSLKIRDSLSVAGQRGFNAAVKLHLSRDYKH